MNLLKKITFIIAISLTSTVYAADLNPAELNALKFNESNFFKMSYKKAYVKDDNYHYENVTFFDETINDTIPITITKLITSPDESENTFFHVVHYYSNKDEILEFFKNHEMNYPSLKKDKEDFLKTLTYLNEINKGDQYTGSFIFDLKSINDKSFLNINYKLDDFIDFSFKTTTSGINIKESVVSEISDKNNDEKSITTFEKRDLKIHLFNMNINFMTNIGFLQDYFTQDEKDTLINTYPKELWTKFIYAIEHNKKINIDISTTKPFNATDIIGLFFAAALVPEDESQKLFEEMVKPKLNVNIYD